MPEGLPNKLMNRDVQSEYTESIVRAHVTVQKVVVLFAMPPVVLQSWILAAVEPIWQFIVAAAAINSLWITMWFAYKKCKAGHFNASGTIIVLSTIVTAALVCSIMHDMAVPMILICLSSLVYSSLLSRRLLFACGAATVVAFSLRELIVYLAPPFMHPLTTVQEGIIGVVLTLTMFPMMAVVLRNAQYRDAKASGRFKSLNEQQAVIIESSLGPLGQISEMLNLSAMEIRALSDTFASQTREQSTAVARINDAVDQVRSIAAQTVESAKASQRSAQELDTKATASSRQLQNLEKGFKQVVVGNQAAQSEFEGLAQQADSIEDILRSNREIAAQIKILAVNAGIQAAKAGEYGEGFRVVAHQLKSLISRTEKSLSQSRGLLEDIRNRAKQSSDTISRSAKLMGKHLDELNATARLIQKFTSHFVDSLHLVGDIQGAAEAQHSDLDRITAGVEYVGFSAKDLNDGSQRLSAELEQLTSSLLRVREVLLPLRSESK